MYLQTDDKMIGPNKVISLLKPGKQEFLMEYMNWGLVNYFVICIVQSI